MFDAYGPFTLKSPHYTAIQSLFDQIQADPTPNIQFGIGVYVVFAKNDHGTYVPSYVGQTYRDFGWRLKEHLDSSKFSELLQNGPVKIFFLARTTRGGKIKRSTDKIKSSRGLRSINQLEFMLIGICVKLNPELLNKRDAAFHRRFWVAGVLDDGPESRAPAAKALGELLKT